MSQCAMFHFTTALTTVQGSSVGPILQSGLGSRYRNNFAMQGVDYPADLASNFLPDGTLPSAITTMQNLLTKGLSF